MTQEGATLQNYNSELVGCIEEVRASERARAPQPWPSSRTAVALSHMHADRINSFFIR